MSTPPPSKKKENKSNQSPDLILNMVLFVPNVLVILQKQNTEKLERMRVKRNKSKAIKEQLAEFQS